jgi:very-short-patch-repair endonuclease
MPPLEKNYRNLLERTVKAARDTAEDAARIALEQLGVGEAAPFSHLTEAERALRRKLRIHGRQLGDNFLPSPSGRGAGGEGRFQSLDRLIEEVAYEHWHRMLFARFLAENDLLMYPDPDGPVAVTLEECEELAVEEGAANGWELAARFAARMLPQIFRLDSPVFQLVFPPEHQQKLERLVADLPLEVFTASDSLGWVYQFWQAKKKDEVNASEVKIGARELPAVTQLFTEPYMVSFLLDNSLGAWWAAQCDAGKGRCGDTAKGIFSRATSEQEIREACAIPGVPLEYLRFVRLPSPIKGESDPTELPSSAEGETDPTELPSPPGRGVGGEGKKAPIPNDILKNARILRKNQTNAEQFLWGLLRDRRFAGKKFRRQHPIGRYILDFYCHELKLAIELDGGQHNEEAGQKHDENRTRFLNEQGIRVIRFWNNEVLQQTDSVLESLWREVHWTQKPSPPTPLPTGEGSECVPEAGDDFFKEEEHSWTPAAGIFGSWPEKLSDLKVLDPCCGSGHFLVAAFLMLVPMRMERDGLSAKEAVDAVLRENIHGLELDQRCVELAAFALALTAWKYPNAGGYRVLPELNVACSGLSVSVAKEEWKQLGLGKRNLTIALDWMHDTFKDAPVLGSLLNPAKTDAAKLVQWDELSSALEQALELPSPVGRGAGGEGYEQQEIAVVAQGLAKAATLLAGRYQWVITNVPYLARGKQNERLRDFCERHYSAAKNDLATVFLDRCLELASPPSPSGSWLAGKEKSYPSRLELASPPSPSGRGPGGEGSLGGTVSVVLPQNWLFLTSYKKFREKLLKNDTWHLIARLGPGAFETISGEVVKAVLISLSRGNSLTPALSQGERGQQTILPLGEGARRADEGGNLIRGVDVSEPRTAAEKAAQLLTGEIKSVEQAKQLENPDASITLDKLKDSSLINTIAQPYKGLGTGDDLRYRNKFWELGSIDDSWIVFRSAPERNSVWGAGNSDVLRWEYGKGELAKSPTAYLRNTDQWSNCGILFGMMRQLPGTIYFGSAWDTTCCVLVPKNASLLVALWCFVESEGLSKELRLFNQKLSVEVNHFGQVPFDLDLWTKVAEEKYPHGLPKPYTDDPTQWIFHGHPCGSVIWDDEKKWTGHGPLRTDDTVLQVAVARLLGYRWPAEFSLTPGPSPEGRGEQSGPLPSGEGGRGQGEGDLELADEQREWVRRCEALLPYADKDGIVCIPPVRGELSAADRLLNLLAAAYNQLPSPLGRGAGGEGRWSNDTLAALLKSADHAGKTLETWLREKFFTQHCKLFQHRPFIWHIWDGLRDGFAALVNYHKLDRKKLETLIYTYLGDWILRQKQDIAGGVDGAQERLAAAEGLKKRLELILEGEAPYDIFVRWKPIEKQPIGWDPDINDGVRLNIRPFMTVPDVGKKGAGVLRDKPNINWKKDRGKDVPSAPWYHVFKGDRINDHHLSLAEKRAARQNGEKEISR